MNNFFRYWGTAIAAYFLNWRASLTLGRQQRKREKHKQHWQAGQVGGGAIVQLGFMTQGQAIHRVRLLKGDNEPIAYVDFERGFIAHGRHPGAEQ